MRCKRELYMATFNACTIRKDSKVGELTHCARSLGIEVLGIQEHRHIHPTKLNYTRSEDYFLVTSSAWRNNAQAATGGVGLLLSNRARKALCIIKSYSPRILLAVFAGNPATSVIVAYSPTNVAETPEIELFYRHLRAAIHDTPAHNFLAILGDFNARLGPEDVRYPFHQSTNRNGEYLAELLMENNLVASNTCFMKRHGKLWTFKDRATEAKRQLDYILTRTKWRNSVLNCEAYNGFASIGSDHRVVSVRLRLSLRVSKQQPKRAVHDWKSFVSSPELQSLYTITVMNRYQFLDETTEDPTERYQKFVHANAYATDSCVPRKARKGKSRRSQHPAVAEARETLNSALKTQRPADEIDQARSQLYEIYDRLQLQDLENKAARIETATHANQYSEAWQVINEISGRKKRGVCGSVAGSGPEERVATWFSHFKNLLGKIPVIDGEDDPIKAVISDPGIDDGPFSMEEYKYVKSSLKVGKSPGPDGIPPEVIKSCDFDDILLRFCNQALIDNQPPRQWSLSDILPIPKTGDMSITDNYRGISLNCIISKMYNRMILNRIRGPIDPHLRISQNGFREGRSTVSHILALRRILEECHRNNLPAIMTFVDFRKAFDSIHRGKMIKILEAYGIPPRLLRAIETMYSNTRAKVVTPDGDTEEFRITAGVLQGDTLAPFLFVIVLDYALRMAIDGKEGELGLTLTPRRSSRQRASTVTDFAFADDIALTSNDAAQAQNLLVSVESECAKIGLSINSKKTKVITCNLSLASPITTIDGAPLEIVEDFRYLGSFINSSEQDIRVRKARAWKALNSMSNVWKSRMPADLKRRIFVATVESVLLYGCECWSLTSKAEKALDGCYTRMLRKALNISWQDFVTNEELYGNLPRLSDKVAWRRLGLVGHCFRNNNLLASRLILWEPSHGHRARGRPPSTFVNTLKRDVGAADSTELKTCLTDRQDWSLRRAARLWPT